jgi:hypothetical protein
MNRFFQSTKFISLSRFLGLAAAVALNTSSPALAQTLTDVTIATGVEFTHITDIDRPVGAGAVWADFDGDGDDDLYATQATGCNRLFINAGNGTFFEELNAAGADDCSSISHGAAVADMDNDGDQDLFVTNKGGNRLYLNGLVEEGTFGFQDVTVLAGINDVASFSTSAAWGDYDGDGLLDLFVGNKNDLAFIDVNNTSCAPNNLWHNNGDGTFSDVAPAYGIASGGVVGLPGCTHIPAWSDYDSDGDVDIIIVNDNGGVVTPNRLFRNDGDDGNGGWLFTDVSTASGFEYKMSGMGVAIGDTNEDGHLDYYLADQGDNKFAVNQGDGTFIESAEVAGILAGDQEIYGGIGLVTWGVAFADIDHDGIEELLVANGGAPESVFPGRFGEDYQDESPVYFYKSDGSWPYTEMHDSVGLTTDGYFRSLALSDYDQDGDLDVYLGNLEGSNLLYRNDSDHTGTSWLQIKLVGTVSNRDAIGARVTVLAGGKTMTREISGGSSYLARHGLTAHFGLGAAAIVDEVTIKWPSGIVQTWTGQPVNTLVTVTEDPTPLISSPAPGSTLDSDTVTFTWTDNGAGVDEWRLLVGTTPGANDIYLSPLFDGTVLSDTVSGLPTDGSTVHVTLLWKIDSVPSQAAYTYTAFDPTTVPEILTPAPGGIFAGDTQTFGWTNNGSAVTDWQLQVGTFAGANNIYDSGVLNGDRVAEVATGLPLDGSQVHVRLSYTLSSVTKHLDYLYTAFNTGTPGRPPEIYTPVPGSMLPGSSATFGWTGNGAPITTWRFTISSVEAGQIYASPIYGSEVLSETVTGLPTDGSTLYLELQWIESGVPGIQSATFTYSAFTSAPGDVDPSVTSPAPGAGLFGPDATFTWDTNGANVTQWRLSVGTTVGASDIYSGALVDPSINTALVTGLPQDASPVYARLQYITTETSGARDYTYISEPETPDARDHSVAREWMEVLLNGIRGDFARPTVHARNLWHISAAMYDAWAAYDDTAGTYLLGNTQNGFVCDYPDSGSEFELDPHVAREQAISFAAYRILRHRFATSPGAADTLAAADDLLLSLGLDANNTSQDTSSGSPAALGNLIAQCYIDFGLVDNANEQNDYGNLFYEPVNVAIEPVIPGNPNISDLNRWQPIALEVAIDQSGNPVLSEPEFLSPEWGIVPGFALSDDDLTIYQRDGFDYYVYHDPGMPPAHVGTEADLYKWGFSLVSVWSSHLDPGDGVTWDISPASIGNIQFIPTDIQDYDQFYDFLEGGDASVGYDVNPYTGLPYEPQFVPRGDYARVLAEFWADGPESETPPGHWFVILNEEVSDAPELVKRIGGTGDIVGPLEWDAKAYFALGGTMHDAAIAAWGIKGWYDYIRPLSAIRAMADIGQSTHPSRPNYNMEGIPLAPGFVELVRLGDPLAGENNEHVNKIKVYAWRGPDFIDDPDVDEAGVGWILAENWWPYQRPTFVTPPFAGYVSGHSTFSRAAAELLTLFTGDEYFPGGMSGFEVTANEFLVFEEGPSVDMTLEWATYRDASDQCSLSRIWGGIHPPADDLPGRLIGEQIGPDAYNLADSYFNGVVGARPQPQDQSIYAPAVNVDPARVQEARRRAAALEEARANAAAARTGAVDARVQFLKDRANSGSGRELGIERDSGSGRELGIERDSASDKQLGTDRDSGSSGGIGVSRD